METQRSSLQKILNNGDPSFRKWIMSFPKKKKKKHILVEQIQTKPISNRSDQQKSQNKGEKTKPTSESQKEETPSTQHHKYEAWLTSFFFFYINYTCLLSMEGCLQKFHFFVSLYLFFF